MNASSTGDPINLCAFAGPHGPVCCGHGSSGCSARCANHASRSRAPHLATATPGRGEYAHDTSGMTTHPRRLALTHCSGSLISCLYHTSSAPPAVPALYSGLTCLTICSLAPSAPMPKEFTSFSRTGISSAVNAPWWSPLRTDQYRRVWA